MTIPRKDLDRCRELHEKGVTSVFLTLTPSYPEGCRTQFTVDGHTFNSLEEAEAFKSGGKKP